MALDFATTYKILVLGDSNVGKTCIVHRYCDERYYDTYISTIGNYLMMPVPPKKKLTERMPYKFRPIFHSQFQLNISQGAHRLGELHSLCGTRSDFAPAIQNASEHLVIS